MPVTISLVNLKGGVGKTSLAIALAEFLGQLAQEVENNKALARRLAEPFRGQAFGDYELD